MSDFVTNFLVPLIQVIAYITIFGGIAIWIISIFWKAYQRKWKWDLKYTILRKKMNEEDIAWCMKRYEEGSDYVDVRKIMLVAGKGKSRTNEIVWIFNKISKKLKGGIYDRPTTRNISKNKIAELPN